MAGRRQDWQDWQDDRPPVCATGLSNVLACVLDNIDYGLLLVDAHRRVVLANRLARRRLERGEGPVRLHGGRLQCMDSEGASRLDASVAGAALHGRRALLTLETATCTEVLALLPAGHAEGSALVLCILGRAELCSTLSHQAFARLHGLTPAEAAVLGALSRGERPAQMARRSGVAVSTVRTQLSSLRMKLGAPDMGALVRQLAVLPPLLGVLLVSGRAERSAG